MTISRREKDVIQPTIFYMMYLIKVDMSFKISDATKIVIVIHAVAIENSERKKFFNSASHYFYNED